MCPPVDDTKAEESREAVVLTKSISRGSPGIPLVDLPLRKIGKESNWYE